MSGVQTESSATSSEAGGRRKRGRKLAVLVVLAAAVAGGYYWYRTSFEAEGERPFVPVYFEAVAIAVLMLLLTVSIGLLAGRDVFKETPMAALRES